MGTAYPRTTEISLTAAVKAHTVLHQLTIEMQLEIHGRTNVRTDPTLSPESVTE
jgi:hypothetical protein